MSTIVAPAGVTFPVDDVAPATKPLPECRTHVALRRALDGDVESCCDYHGTVVEQRHYQPLLAAVYLAFSQHRPLVLSPDAVWVTIAQGVAHHMAIHGERLRPRFVTHRGKVNLVVEVRGWVRHSPENPWPEAFAGWTSQIRDHVGPAVHDALVCDFTTTGPVERAVSEIVMMDTFQRYFHYVLLCICGIPTVTLEGTPADWDRLKEKAAALRVFDMDWWLEHLLPLCDHFARASRGDVDLAHWRAICKRREEYGGDVINGWVCKLFPYVREFPDGPCRRRNPVFETGEGINTFQAPPGLSYVPFTWADAATRAARPMEAVGGLVGVTQDPATLALRPKLGWAVREAPKIDVLLSRLEDSHVTRPGAQLKRINESGARMPTGLPADLSAFYHRTDGARLFARPGGAAAYEIVPLASVRPLNWSDPRPRPPRRRRGAFDDEFGRTWWGIGNAADGSGLAINIDPLRPPGASRDSFYPVCACPPDATGTRGQVPVVALSFTGLLERLLDSGGHPYWLAPGFKDYGQAEQYTRRE